MTLCQPEPSTLLEELCKQVTNTHATSHSDEVGTHTLACLTAQWAEHYLGLAARLGDALAILGVVRAHTMHLV